MFIIKWRTRAKPEQPRECGHVICYLCKEEGHQARGCAELVDENSRVEVQQQATSNKDEPLVMELIEDMQAHFYHFSGR